MMFSALGQKAEVWPQTEISTSDSKSSSQTNPEPLFTAYLEQFQKIREINVNRVLGHKSKTSLV